MVSFMNFSKIPAPNLITAQTGPLKPLEKIILKNRDQIETWFHEQWLNTPPPVYGSVDLRNAGFKLAPVDMNLYPAGFNNLNPELLPLAIQAVQAFINQYYPDCKSIVFIPENHSRNLFYWENVWAQLNIIRNAGVDVRVGADPEFFPEAKTIELSNGKNIFIEPIKRIGNHITLDNFNPSIIWLNNDFSSGIPSYLKNITQPICPPIELGWHSRLKSIHFEHYKNVVAEFSKAMNIDSWLLDPLFRYCGKVDFMHREGEECLASNVEKLLMEIQKKYDEYNIQQKPFVIVKADSGTYGMSVMSIKSVDEIRGLNRKQRTHMSASKGSQKVHRVIIQEGVYSFETVGKNQSTAEPVIYMIGKNVVGGFYRLHKNKNSSDSLNTPGMEFEPLRIDHSSDSPNRFYAYSVVARLSMLAAAREQQNLEQKK